MFHIPIPAPHHLILSVIAAPLLCVAQPARAAGPIADVICDTRPRMEQRLAVHHRARRHAMGLRGPEQVMEVWTAEDGDWTLVVSYASGRSCIVAMGEHWQGLRSEDPA
ncbi:hypothetical protein [Pseudooceanicola aestuarii]|uniref:hypothetical protein n=1 Tax=Pseudooceanicola aestuarii TaxID=2697319 RepID=UPI001EF8B68B|nr:hypothetical protein [Pseudooceanicola aestuarii]